MITGIHAPLPAPQAPLRHLKENPVVFRGSCILRFESRLAIVSLCSDMSALGEAAFSDPRGVSDINVSTSEFISVTSKQTFKPPPD
jgi:hypothetical protein